MNLLQMSFAGGIMIVVIVAIRAITIHRLPKKTFLLLWGIVLCRLLIPYSVPSAVSVYMLIQGNSVVMERLRQIHAAELLPVGMEAVAGWSDQPWQNVSAGRPAEPGQAASAGQEVETGQAAQPGQTAAAGQTAQIGQTAAADQSVQMSQAAAAGQAAHTEQPGRVFALSSVWMTVWILGAFAFLLYFAVSYLRSCRKFRESLPVEADMLQEWYRTHQHRRKLSVRQSDQIKAPLTYGFFHPVILMPKTADWEKERQIRYILEHEYVHIQRCDAALKLVIVFAVCIHWFNPFVWVMYILINQDIELSCDETVIRRFGEETKGFYARLLVAMEEKKNGPVPFGSSFSKTAIEERITAIMKIKKSSVAMIVAAAMMVTGVTAVFGTSAATDVQVSGVIPDTAFTDEEYRKLLALRYDGYEKMSISDYQERVWADTDTEAYRALLERFAQDETILNLRAENEVSSFLHDTLIPLCSERWQSHDFSGGIQTDCPYPGEQARFEYVFTLTILDAEQLTVGAYQDARAGMYQKLNRVLEGRTEEELQDADEMEVYLREQTERFAAECETPGLQITAEEWTYMPLMVDTEEEERRLREASLRQSEEERKKVLEPYLSLGLTYEYDPSADNFRMYYQGKEVKSITDEETGIWISEIAGSGVGFYAEDAVELFAVYEDGELTGLREADEQEAALLSEARASASAERDEQEAELLSEARARDSAERNEQETAFSSEERDLAPADWETRPPYGTDADYESLLALKTADYEDMTLQDFNASLLEWADADYDRMERVNMDRSWEDWHAELSEEEKTFVSLTVWASGAENGEFVRSIYTGRPPEDPNLGEYTLEKSETVNGGSAWCNLFYQFSYHIPDNSQITVGERDRCVGGMIDSIRAYWNETELDELLKMEESDLLDVLQSFAEEYSSERISVHIDTQHIGFEKMDERKLEIPS